MRLHMRCPRCGCSTMHYGEVVLWRGELRSDMFSCRGCGFDCDMADIEELATDYANALAQVKASLKGGDAWP